MRVLVTGGAGFIGSALVRFLLRDMHGMIQRVANVDKLTYASSVQRLAGADQNPRYAFYRHDIADAVAMQRVFALEQPDVVVHLAAESHVDNSIAAPDAFIQSNIVGSYTLLNAALEYWHGLSAERQEAFRFVQVSTDEVYGDRADVLDAGSVAATVQSAYRPSSPYAASKAAADHLADTWHRTYGLPVMVTHCTNNYGAWQHPEKLLPLVMKQALAGGVIPIYGDGQQRRDWLHVGDHVSGLWLVMQRGVAGQHYHFASGQQVTNLEMVHQLCAALQQAQPSVERYVDLIEYVTDRAGHDRLYALDCTESVQQLDWQPEVSLADGLRDMVDWAVAHQDWLREAAR